ncbi:hypothetical protein SUDANB58_01765 [Streptomyces sp. enrichment culture]
MLKRAIGRVVSGTVCALSAVVLTSTPSSAAYAIERFAGTVYDDEWSHYAKRRCATDPVKFFLDKWPDGDATRHIASAAQGGGSPKGEKYVAGGDSSFMSMGFSSGCFYWNTRQYEGTFETDTEDSFQGEIRY